MDNYDERPLSINGMSLERHTAIEIMEYLGVKKKGEGWYEEEDEVTEMLIGLTQKYTSGKSEETN